MTEDERAKMGAELVAAIDERHYVENKLGSEIEKLRGLLKEMVDYADSSKMETLPQNWEQSLDDLMQRARDVLK